MEIVLDAPFGELPHKAFGFNAYCEICGKVNLRPSYWISELYRYTVWHEACKGPLPPDLAEDLKNKLEARARGMMAFG